MRLIDADSITEKIMNAFEETLRIALKSGTFDLEGVMLKIKCYLDNEPTAFDVDDVTKKIREEIDKCNIKLNENPQTLNENPNTVNMLALCERRKALREALWYVNKDVMV